MDKVDCFDVMWLKMEDGWCMGQVGVKSASKTTNNQSASADLKKMLPLGEVKCLEEEMK